MPSIWIIPSFCIFQNFIVGISFVARKSILTSHRYAGIPCSIQNLKVQIIFQHFQLCSSQYIKQAGTCARSLSCGNYSMIECTRVKFLSLYIIIVLFLSFHINHANLSKVSSHLRGRYTPLHILQASVGTELA